MAGVHSRILKQSCNFFRIVELSTWHQHQSQERGGLYVSKPKNGIDATLKKTLKEYAARYYQLMIGHGAVESFLVRIGLIGTLEYWWCSARERTVIGTMSKTDGRNERKEETY